MIEKVSELRLNNFEKLKIQILKKSSLIKCEQVIRNIPSWEDEQARVITCSLLINDLHRINFISVYVPNGSSVGDPKFSYKLLFV